MEVKEKHDFDLEDEDKVHIETDSISEESSEEDREQWDKKIEFILSMLGYIVGLGNFWRFPYLCMRNGGGAFLFPFIICCIFIAFPLFFLEVSLGQFTARSTVQCWEVCPLFRGVGMGMVILNVVCALYYVMVVTWTLYYLYNSFISPLPWTTCGNIWNTEQCYNGPITALRNNNYTRAVGYINNTEVHSSLLTAKNFSDVNSTISNSSSYGNFSIDRISSQEEFWQYKVLDMSKGIEEMGSLNLNILICLLVSWVVLFLCLMKGIKSVGKVVYVTATLPYILMIILLVRGLTLPGAMNGIRYYIYPNFTRIGDPKVWIEAAIQVFYSTCVCWGPLITMASYNKFNNNCLRDSAMLITMGEGFSVFGGFVVFSVLGFMAHSNGVEIEDVVKSGPGLIYIAYPEVVAKLPLPNLWAVIFFIMILTIGLDSQFAGIEPIIAVFCDSFRYIRKRRMMFTAVLMASFFLLGLPFCFQGGIYVFQLMDWYIAAFCIPIFGIIECLVFGWIYGADNFSRDIELMIGRPIPIVIRILWCFVTPVLLFILLVMIVVRYESPTYGDYSYPLLANVFGFTYALVPLLPVIICAVITVFQSEGNTVLEKFRNSLRPTMLWQPGDKNERKRYMEMDVIDTQTFSERISLTLLGR
ncbi:sodium- and chloride-dependent glycine transporter 1-like [Mytilus galloprovincialis]|uniref:sodium- and chloride-dependent glycine transporter 1-like n=1 Tax=Mytilus galloprovincialis TaxID=29158 RepID=UPI003F7B5F1B